MTNRVGTTVHTSLAVYARGDGSLYFMEDGLRIDMHGSTLWRTKSNNTLMRGSKRHTANVPGPPKTITKKSNCSFRK